MFPLFHLLHTQAAPNPFPICTPLLLKALQPLGVWFTRGHGKERRYTVYENLRENMSVGGDQRRWGYGRHEEKWVSLAMRNGGTLLNRKIQVGKEQLKAQVERTWKWESIRVFSPPSNKSPIVYQREHLLLNTAAALHATEAKNVLLPYLLLQHYDAPQLSHSALCTSSVFSLPNHTTHPYSPKRPGFTGQA